MARKADPDLRERVLHTAEILFRRHGYHGVSMRDIAEALSIRKPSLYHYAPGGKEALFVTVTARILTRHQGGIADALASADGDIAAQLQALARWFIDNAPMGLLAMLTHDMPSLSDENKARLSALLEAAVWVPVVGVFEAAQARGEIRALDARMLAGMFLALMDGFTFIITQPIPHPDDAATIADRQIEILLEGIVARNVG